MVIFRIGNGRIRLVLTPGTHKGTHLRVLTARLLVSRTDLQLLLVVSGSLTSFVRGRGPTLLSITNTIMKTSYGGPASVVGKNVEALSLARPLLFPGRKIGWTFS